MNLSDEQFNTLSKIYKLKSKTYEVFEVNTGEKVNVILYKRPVSNADRIRSMSDEELAKFISLDAEHDYDGILRWLQQEVEHE